MCRYVFSFSRVVGRWTWTLDVSKGTHRGLARKADGQLFQDVRREVLGGGEHRAGSPGGTQRRARSRRQGTVYYKCCIYMCFTV